MFYSIESIREICDSLAKNGKKIVLATGFFDLLHEEHINFLQKAKNMGDVLIVAVESDERAKVIKGEGRPVEPQEKRCQQVSQYASYVVKLNHDFNNFEAYDSLMASVRPSIYAVSSHTNHLENKKLLAEKYGGQLLVVHEWNPNVSTTKILERGIQSS